MDVVESGDALGTSLRPSFAANNHFKFMAAKAVREVRRTDTGRSSILLIPCFSTKTVARSRDEGVVFHSGRYPSDTEWPPGRLVYDRHSMSSLQPADIGAIPQYTHRSGSWCVEPSKVCSTRGLSKAPRPVVSRDAIASLVVMACLWPGWVTLTRPS